MPGPITHLKAVHYYDKAYKGAFGASLYLGAISPDSVNINGHAPKQKRWPAHLRHSDLKVWCENAKAFYNVNKGRVDEAFLRGYILHILTDILWDKEFDMPLFQLLKCSGVDDSKLKAERWNELYGYERQQINETWFREEALPMLTEAQPQIVGTLDLKEVAIWQQQVISLELPVGKPPKFVDDEFLKLFFKGIIDLADSIFA